VDTTAKMGVATEISAEQAGVAMAKLASQMNLPIPQVKNLGSAINELSNNFATSTDEIVDSLLRSSAQMTQMNLTAQESAGLSAAMNQVSESAERAGTRLRSLGQTLTDPNMVERLAKALGMTAGQFKSLRDDSPIQTIKMLARTLTSGSEEGERLAGVLDRTSRTALSALGSSLEEVDRAIQISNASFAEATSLEREYAAASKSLNNRISVLWNNIREMGIIIGNTLIPNVKTATDGIIEWIQSVQTWLDNNKKMILGAAKLARTLLVAGGALLALGAAAKIFGFMISPIGLVVAAVLLLAEAFGLVDTGLSDLVGNFRIGGTKISTWWEVAMLKILNAWHTVADVIGTGWDGLVVSAKTVGNQIYRAFAIAAKNIASVFWEAVRGIADTFLWLVEKAVDFEYKIGLGSEEEYKKAKGAIEEWKGSVKDFTDSQKDMAEDLYNGAADSAKEADKERWKAFFDKYSDVAKRIEDRQKNTNKAIALAFEKDFDDANKSAGENLQDKLKNAIDGVKKRAEEIELFGIKPPDDLKAPEIKMPEMTALDMGPFQRAFGTFSAREAMGGLGGSRGMEEVAQNTREMQNGISALNLTLEQQNDILEAMRGLG
jgi:TP901 family phage tail tape measure protein